MDPTAWVGRDIDGRYLVESVLGVGGMGMVLRAKHRFTGVAVAIKILRPELQLDTGVQGRFLAEAQAPNAIGHPAIVKVLDAGRTAEGTLYMAMELLVGRSLRAALGRGDLTAEQVKRIVVDLCTVLGHAHARHFIHRDLKPDNVFLAAPNDEVKLLDFGIAKMLDDVRQLRTAAGAVLGTPAYMAPEQLADASSVDARADLWAVGVMSYEMLTGRLPLSGATPQALLAAVAAGESTPIRTYLPNVSREVELFFERALARDPRRRFGAAIELAHALSPLVLPQAWRVASGIGVASTAASGQTVATGTPVATPMPAPARVPAPVHAPAFAAPQRAPVPAPVLIDVARPRRSSKLLPIAGMIALLAITVGITLAVTGGSRGARVAAAPDAPASARLDQPAPEPATPVTPQPAKPDVSEVRPQTPVKAPPVKPPVVKPDPKQRDPRLPDPAGPLVSPDEEPAKPAPPKPVALAQPTLEQCQQRCNTVARTCGTQLPSCVTDCQTLPGAIACFDRSDRNCADGAMCATGLLCGGRVPSGNQTCPVVVNCQLGCRGNLSCMCDCTSGLDRRFVFELARINSCALRCGMDPTCMATNCAAQNRACGF